MAWRRLDPEELPKQGGDGDVQNPDEHLTFFTAYMAWWAADACAPAGSGKGGKNGTVGNGKQTVGPASGRS